MGGTMPYTSISQLPDPIRNNLPAPAQKIFVKAFNGAYEKLKPGQDEIPAFKIGWNAVKKTYEKKNGKWQRKLQIQSA
jgi:cation transport regulator